VRVTSLSYTIGVRVTYNNRVTPSSLKKWETLPLMPTKKWVASNNHETHTTCM